MNDGKQYNFPFTSTILEPSLASSVKSQRQRRRGKQTYLDKQTHIYAPPAALTFLPVCVRNIHQIRVRTHFPRDAAHLFPPQCINSKCFSLLVLCGHMSVSSSHRFLLFSLLHEMSKSKSNKGFKECREINKCVYGVHYKHRHVKINVH